MAHERRIVSEEFKREAFKLAGQTGASKTGISRDLDIGANLLGRWCRDDNVEASAGASGVKLTAFICYINSYVNLSSQP